MVTGAITNQVKHNTTSITTRTGIDNGGDKRTIARRSVPEPSFVSLTNFSERLPSRRRVADSVLAEVVPPPFVFEASASLVFADRGLSSGLLRLW